MIAFSLFVNLYFAVLGYVKSKDTREWWDLSQGEKEELLRKHLPEGEYTEELGGDFPEGWFDLEDWEKKAILDKNLDDYYKDEADKEFDFTGISNPQGMQRLSGAGKMRYCLKRITKFIVLRDQHHEKPPNLRSMSAELRQELDSFQ
jgi:hypothetical protein